MTQHSSPPYEDSEFVSPPGKNERKYVMVPVEEYEALRRHAQCVPDGFMLVPIEPTAMMALRGYQAADIFEKGDTFGDYIDDAELPAALAPTHRFDADERGWMLAAAAYRGCIAGYVETLRRLAKDPNDEVATSWNKPIPLSFTSTERGMCDCGLPLKSCAECRQAFTENNEGGAA